MPTIRRRLLLALAAAPFLKDTADKELAERVNSVRSFVESIAYRKSCPARSVT